LQWGAAGFSRVAVIATALLSVAIIGTLDFLTGYEISFAVFYLLPVGIASWYATKSWGLAFAVGSSFVWYVADTAAGYPYSHAAIPIWNAIVRLMFFALTALLLSKLRAHLLAEIHSAKTDSLTGLLNPRAFRERLEHDLALMGRVDMPLSVMYIDLDDFKAVNDQHGHHAGDRLLIHVANQLRRSVRVSDSVARLGGDEFALILPGANFEDTQLVARKMGDTFQHADEFGHTVTCSIGAIVFHEKPESPADAVRAADRLMYAAKASGKNCQVVERYSVSNVEDWARLKGVGNPGRQHQT
jgi:diguanylate cyclase (GGDEF)-like protein